MMERKPGLLENPGAQVPVFFLNILSLTGLNIFISFNRLWPTKKIPQAYPLTVVKTGGGGVGNRIQKTMIGEKVFASDIYVWLSPLLFT